MAMQMNVTIKQLELLTHLAELGTVSEVAKKMNLTQPAVTMQLKKLESLLDTKLLKLQGRNLVLTEDGNRVLGHAKIVLSDMSQLYNSVDYDRRQISGTVKTGVTDVGLTYAFNLMGKLKANFANIEIGCDYDDDVKVVVDRAKNGENDLAFVVSKFNHKELDRHVVGQYHLYIYAPNTHHLARRRRISLDELKNETWLVSSQGSVSAQVTHEIVKELKIPKKQIMQLPNSFSMIPGVAANFGICVLASNTMMLYDEPDRVTHLNVEGFPQTHELYMYVNKQALQRKEVDAAVEFFLSHK